MEKEIISKFEKHIQYSFKDKSLIKDALTHPSYEKSKFELLEFIGDRVIGLVISEMLFKLHPKDEKEYAQRFILLTNREAMIEVAQKICLQNYIMWKGCESHKNTILSDACESLMGAIFLDSDLDFVSVFIKRYWKSLDNTKFSDLDPKSFLQDWASKNNKNINYSLISQTGPAHNKNYVVELSVNKIIVRGQGTSIKMAEKNAASKFLKDIGI